MISNIFASAVRHRQAETKYFDEPQEEHYQKDLESSFVQKIIKILGHLIEVARKPGLKENYQLFPLTLKFI